MTILLTAEPRRDPWNPWGPFEFGIYRDCLTAGEMLFGILDKSPFTIECRSKSTGEVNATWTVGK